MHDESTTIVPTNVANLHLEASPSALAATGELTVRTCWQMRDALTSLVADHQVTIDLKGIDKLDAAGLVAVTAPAMTLRRRGANVTVQLPLDPDARRIADLAGVLQLLAA